MPPRSLPVLLGLALVAMVAASVLSGEPTWLIPGLILLVVLAGYAIVEWGVKKRLERNHDGNMDAAMADSDDPLPASHLVTDDDTPLGDTKEAHDEVSPHDLPKDHPGRHEAEQITGDRYERDDAGVTRGTR